MTRQTDNVYRLDHAVTAKQKIKEPCIPMVGQKWRKIVEIKQMFGMFVSARQLQFGCSNQIMVLKFRRRVGIK